MRCPECGSSCRTLETRSRPDGLKRRRYECKKGHRFTTLSSAANLHISPMRNKEKAMSEMTIVPPRRKGSRRKKATLANVRATSIFDAALIIKQANE